MPGVERGIGRLPAGVLDRGRPARPRERRGLPRWRALRRSPALPLPRTEPKDVTKEDRYARGSFLQLFGRAAVGIGRSRDTGSVREKEFQEQPLRRPGAGQSLPCDGEGRRPGRH